MVASYNIEKITFDSNYIYLMINNKNLKISLDRISSKLKTADDFQREFYKISPSGYGIHWPLLDEDLSVEGLLKMAK